MTNVKWLARIRSSTAFAGYQQTTSYRFRRDADDEGVPVARMAPRALMVPPGEPDFLTRERFLPARPTVIEGRAWSGHGSVERVEFTCDGGGTWHDAVLDPLVGRWAWRRWTYAWESPSPGHHVLSCRATDAAGNVQPVVPEWNVGGYANNAVQRVPVTVRAQAELEAGQAGIEAPRPSRSRQARTASRSSAVASTSGSRCPRPRARAGSAPP